MLSRRPGNPWRTRTRPLRIASSVVLTSALLVVVALMTPHGTSGVSVGRAPSGIQSSSRATSPCVFATAAKPVSVAFCDSFAEGPTTNPPGSRSGQLNGTVWGVSRDLGFNNLGQGMYAAGVKHLQIGGTCPTAKATIETDVQICGGVLNDVVNDNPDVTVANMNKVNDNGTVTSLAMYPKQPFDFAGRTGTVVFDVSDDSGGMHDAWPEFWITSLPSPDPFVHFASTPDSACSLDGCEVARRGLERPCEES